MIMRNFSLFTGGPQGHELITYNNGRSNDNFCHSELSEESLL